jgi:hypothetical protein
MVVWLASLSCSCSILLLLPCINHSPGNSDIDNQKRYLLSSNLAEWLKTFWFPVEPQRGGTPMASQNAPPLTFGLSSTPEQAGLSSPVFPAWLTANGRISLRSRRFSRLHL